MIARDLKSLIILKLLNLKRSISPKLLNKLRSNKYEKKDFKVNQIYKKIKEYQKFIKKNFEYVGENFTYEARSIHYNNKKRKKGIFGKASTEDINELKDEGIETEVIPWLEDNSN